MLTRKELLGQEFIAAGPRGLTGAQMRTAVGRDWRRRLHDLVEDGWVFREEPSRFDRGTFRWVLLAEPVPVAENTCELPAQPVLFEPEGPRPANALEAA